MSLLDALLLISGHALPYAAIAAAIGVASKRYSGLRREMRTQQERWIKRQQSVEAELGKLRGAVAELRVSVSEAEQKASVAPVTGPAFSGLNLTHRSQAIRMHRRGERAEQIAAALSVPLNEVELLLKVHMAITGNGTGAETAAQ